MNDREAVRAVVRGDPLGEGIRDAVLGRARELGVMGWVCADAAGILQVHAEGDPGVVAQLVAYLQAAPAPAQLAEVDVRGVEFEGHEQFALRGVSAGEFVVQEHLASTHHFDLRLELDGVMRSWAVPKGPSMDPGIKRLAVEVEDHAKSHNSFEGRHDGGGVIVWDQGAYEQRGRVSWPQALDRGHAVFVLHGQKLRGGFALQRTGAGTRAQWLLIKRRDREAQPGSDVVADHPRSVLSDRTLDELLAGD